MRETKKCSIEWMGTIPSEWEVLKNKYLMRKEKNIVPTYNGENILSLTMNGVIVRDLENPSGKMPATFDGYQQLKAGNLLMCLFDIDVTPRCIGRIQNDGLTSPAYSQFVLSEKADQNYYYYYYLALDYTKELLHLAKNLRHSLTEEQFGFIEAPVPSIIEQKAIAKKLDEKAYQIDTLIANQEAQIEKLKAYKQSLITEIVTKGLDPNVAMKDSGAEWIGQIPSHWKLNRLKYISTYNDESLSEKEDDELSIRYVEIGSVTLENGITHIEEMKFSDAPSRARRIARKGDVIVSTVRTYLKAIAPINEDGLIVSTGFCVIRPNGKLIPKYVEYFAKSNLFSDYVSSNSVGISYPAINATTLMGFNIVEPPKDEQLRIADFLDDKCLSIDKLIEIKKQKIEKLNQYKKSIIYEYVTGKKEVVC